MPKAYWIAQIEVDDTQEYQKYVDANAAAFKKYAAVCFARGGRFKAMEGSGRGRNVIWEFESFQDAVDCYNSAEYQRARSFRASISRGDIIIVEGLVNGPTPAASF